MSGLTPKQKIEVKSCIAGFLKENGFERSLKEFLMEAKLENENLDYSKLNLELEGKFNLIARMQIRISQLEKQLTDFGKIAAANPLANHTNVNGVTTPRTPELFTCSGHRGAVNSIIFHPVYSFFVTAGDDSTIKLWNIESGLCERTLSGHTDAVNDLAFSTDGKLLASCSNDMYVKIWEMTEAFECVKTYAGHEHSITSVAFVRPNVLLSASRDNCIKMWDLSNVTCIQVFRDNSWVRMIRLHQDGKFFASAGSDHSVRIWDLESGDTAVELQEHSNVVEAISWAPDTVATELKLSNSTFDSTGVNVFIEGKPLILASGSRDSTIKIWHVNTQVTLFTLSDHSNWVHGLAWHPNGKSLNTVGDDKTLRTFSVGEKFQLLKTLSPHKNFIKCVAMDSYGNFVATGSTDHTVKLFESH